MDKACGKCRVTKPLGDFAKNIKNKDGLYSWCRKCSSEVSRQYHRKNAVKHRAMSQAYWDQRRHRWWAIQTLRHHRVKYTVSLTVDQLTELAIKATSCPLCNRELRWTRDPNSPRIVSVSPSLDRIHNGKLISKQNVMILCYQCNTTKGSRSLKEFQRYCAQIVRLRFR